MLPTASFDWSPTPALTGAPWHWRLAELYNGERLHQALGYRTPCEVFQAPSVTRGYVDNASALSTSPQAHHQQHERNSIELEEAL